MPYPDWRATGLTWAMGLDVWTTLAGTSSLRLQGSRTYARRVIDSAMGYIPGLASGQMRGLFRLSHASVGGGFFLMASTTDFRTFGHSLYEAGKRTGTSGNMAFINRIKNSVG